MIFVRGFILAALAFLLTEIQVIAGQCSGSVQDILLTDGESGSIKSPNYPYSYGSNEDCKWRIRAPFYQKVLIYFTSLDLEGCCSCDVVTIYDGLSYDNSLLTKGCGSSLPPSVYSTGRYVYITFQSDATVQGNGFVVQYKALNSYYTATMSPSPSLYGACTPHSDKTMLVGSYSSSSIASPSYNNIYYTTSQGTTCSWTIDTTRGFYLELTFDRMSISSCYSGCTCGYVKVYDGSTSSSSILGTFCTGHQPSTVISNGNQMFIKYYGYQHSFDRFRATVSSAKGPSVDAAGIAVPLVIAIILFAIIIAVIICTKINRRSAGPAGLSSANDVPLQPLSHSTAIAPPLTVPAPPPPMQSYSLNTEVAPFSYQEPFPTASASPLPSSSDNPQGETAQL